MRRLAPTLVVALVLLALPATAPAATGDLTFKDCIAKDVSAPCTAVPNQVLEGGFELAVSPNGNFVYVADGNDSVVGFTRSAADGSLAYQGCVDNGDDVGCTHLNKFLLGVVRGLAFSPDGSSLYAASEASNAVVRFTVGSDGALTFASCVQDNSINLGCATTVTNLDAAEQVAVSPDGNSVYVTGETGDAVYHLAPDLSFRQCYTEAVTTGCTQARPLDAARGVAVSPNGAQVYVTSIGDDAMSWFNRASDGTLSLAGCLSDDDIPGPTDACAKDSGVDYDRLSDIAFNTDGTHVYVADEVPLGAVYHFSRDGTTGTLTRQDCLADNFNNTVVPGCTLLSNTTGSGLKQVLDAVVSPDSANLYAAATTDSALSTFGLDSATGDMTFIRCLRSGAIDGCSAFGNSFVFDAPRGVAMSSDGRDLYVANGAGTPALLHFERDAPGARTGGVGPGAGPGPGPGTDPGSGPGTGTGSGPGTTQGPLPSAVRCNGLRATIVGTAGSNTIRGTRRRDVIAALGGNDVVKSLGGNDVVCGGNGRDTLDGGADRDLLLGQGGADVLKGAGGVDRLLGGPGADRLVGGAGADALLGGPGRDRLVGGPGRDTTKQ